MTPTRVLISALSANSYGGDSYFQSLLPVLSRASGRVECIVVASDDRYLPLCPPHGAVQVIKIRMPSVARGPVRVAWEQTLLPSLARAQGAELIFSPNNSGVVVPGLPCVIAVRNMEPLVPVQPHSSISMRARHAMLRAFTRLSARRATRVIAVSGAVREAVLAIGVPSDRIDVVYHGADDLPKPDPLDSRRGGYMAASAKFVRYANLETMIRAFRRVRERGYAGELLVAGGSYDQAYELDIRHLVAECGLQDKVRFLGYRPRSEVLVLMRHCDAFLFPSTLEACPFTLLEAMSQGAAIVATTCAPMPEFAGDGAAMVGKNDIEAFADAAWRFANDREGTEKQRLRARQRSEAFRWDVTVERMIRCWDRAARGNAF